MSTSMTATPAAGTPAQTGKTTWTIDTAHSHVGFAIKHLMIATVRGQFPGVRGTVTVDDTDPTTASIDVTIPTSTVTTGDEKRDGHLRSPDFFDVERYPNITFRSRRIERKSSDALRVVGDLTIRGVTREVVLDVELLGRAKDPWGQEHAAFEANTKINRADYGLTWNTALETGGMLVGDEVKISIEAQLLKQA
ncbi:MAG: YceI family protein [Gemmatimonadota bacterium]|nr:YceI family protein [Gemmatimonadota bacterium]